MVPHCHSVAIDLLGQAVRLIILFDYFQSLMGFFFWLNSVALIEDLAIKEEYESASALLNDIEGGYQQVSEKVSIF